jgi:hypothetical protein
LSIEKLFLNDHSNFCALYSSEEKKVKKLFLCLLLLLIKLYGIILLYTVILQIMERQLAQLAALDQIVIDGGVLAPAQQEVRLALLRLLTPPQGNHSLCCSHHLDIFW